MRLTLGLNAFLMHHCSLIMAGSMKMRLFCICTAKPGKSVIFSNNRKWILTSISINKQLVPRTTNRKPKGNSPGSWPCGTSAPSTARPLWACSGRVRGPGQGPAPRPDAGNLGCLPGGHADLGREDECAGSWGWSQVSGFSFSPHPPPPPSTYILDKKHITYHFCPFRKG
jgi:hypothetical protein